MPNNKSSKVSKIPERVLPAEHNYGQSQRKIRQITDSVPTISSESDMELDSYNCGGCKKTVYTNDSPVECDFCNHAFCYKC